MYPVWCEFLYPVSSIVYSPVFRQGPVSGIVHSPVHEKKVLSICILSISFLRLLVQE